MPTIPFNKNLSTVIANSKPVTKIMAFGETVYLKQTDIPQGYKRCDYILNSSTTDGGVDLGFKYRLLDYTLEAQFKQDRISNGMVCGTFTNNAGALWLYNYNVGNNASFHVDACYSGAWKLDSSIFLLDTLMHTAKIVGSADGLLTTFCDGDQKTYKNISEWAAEESTENLCIFGRKPTGGNNYAGRIYYLKVWKTITGEYICDLIPCRRLSDNAAGFWDKATLQFFTSPYWSAHDDNE